jgi:hypothetical protein
MLVTFFWSTERTIWVSSSLSVPSFWASGEIVSAICAEALHQLVDAIGIVAERGREALDILDGVADRAGIVLDQPLDAAEHLVGALGDGADGLDDVLEFRALGDDGRQLLAGLRLQHRGVRLAAEQLNRDDAGKALRLDARAGIDAQRRRVVDLDHRIDAARIIRQQFDSRHLADPQAVEEHARATPEPGHGAAENDAHILPPAGAAAVEPVDKAERRCEDRKREQPDQRIICPRFHCLALHPRIPAGRRALARSPPK